MNKFKIISFIGLLLSGCGEKYSNEGHLLFQEIHKNLISQGICLSEKNCYEKFEIKGGHGNQVNFSIYNPHSRKGLAIMIKFIVESGLKITKGIPISIYVYPKSRKEYGNFLIGPKPMIEMEISK
jgi:hypothetical protein